MPWNPLWPALDDDAYLQMLQDGWPHRSVIVPPSGGVHAACGEVIVSASTLLETIQRAGLSLPRLCWAVRAGLFARLTSPTNISR